jgi:transposase-like protein
VQGPKTPVERLQDFRPGFCPWPECSQHRRSSSGYRFHRHGFYATARRRKIPRFLCRTCGRLFSRQSFSTSYYLKRPELLVPVAAGLVAGSAHRQLARSLDCAPSTVTRLSARLGRHALLLTLALEAPSSESVREAIAADHFGTFEFTQDLPFGAADAGGARLLVRLWPSTRPRMRVPGGGSAEREARRRSPPDAAPTRADIPAHSAADSICSRCSFEENRSFWPADGKAQYVDAPTTTQRGDESTSPSIPTRSGPKGSPRSREALIRDREMFPVDQFHALLRHSRADHKRRRSPSAGA